MRGRFCVGIPARAPGTGRTRHADLIVATASTRAPRRSRFVEVVGRFEDGPAAPPGLPASGKRLGRRIDTVGASRTRDVDGRAQSRAR